MWTLTLKVLIRTASSKKGLKEAGTLRVETEVPWHEGPWKLRHFLLCNHGLCMLKIIVIPDIFHGVHFRLWFLHSTQMTKLHITLTSSWHEVWTRPGNCSICCVGQVICTYSNFKTAIQKVSVFYKAWLCCPTPSLPAGATAALPTLGVCSATQGWKIPVTGWLDLNSQPSNQHSNYTSALS